MIGVHVITKQLYVAGSGTAEAKLVSLEFHIRGFDEGRTGQTHFSEQNAHGRLPIEKHGDDVSGQTAQQRHR